MKTVRLPYVEQGDPTGTPVLLLHGITDSQRSWEPVLPLLPQSIRALAVTMRGHGDAERPDAGYRVEDYAADAIELLDELGLESVVLGGHSLGTYVAAQIAIEQPQRVAALVLEGAPGTPANNALLPEVAAAAAELDDPIDPSFVREFQASTTERPLAPGLLDTFVEESLKLPASTWSAAFADLMRIDLSEQLSDIAAPTLLVHGVEDAIASSREQEWLLARLPNARLVSLDRTGHAPHWERPERYVTELATFAAAAYASRGASAAPREAPALAATTSKIAMISRAARPSPSST
jgi:non-heme chloroperoxidase